MTSSRDPLTVEPRFVLVFDFCSSTLILEDLLRNESEDRWRNLLIDIKRFYGTNGPACISKSTNSLAMAGYCYFRWIFRRLNSFYFCGVCAMHTTAPSRSASARY